MNASTVEKQISIKGFVKDLHDVQVQLKAHNAHPEIIDLIKMAQSLIFSLNTSNPGHPYVYNVLGKLLAIKVHLAKHNISLLAPYEGTCKRGAFVDAYIDGYVSMFAKNELNEPNDYHKKAVKHILSMLNAQLIVNSKIQQRFVNYVVSTMGIKDVCNISGITIIDDCIEAKGLELDIVEDDLYIDGKLIEISIN